ncbi:MAG: hypothetical protein DRG50_06550 [Deltaproteobacteria bacterium]|nr:MAG: hypothetical protein DRG50_06550 [Deltaproteobacteria bacterium]
MGKVATTYLKVEYYLATIDDKVEAIPSSPCISIKNNYTPLLPNYIPPLLIHFTDQHHLSIWAEDLPFKVANLYRAGPPYMPTAAVSPDLIAYRATFRNGRLPPSLPAGHRPTPPHKKTEECK